MATLFFTAYKDSDGDEKWWDGNGKLIHWKNSDGNEEWWEYDANGNLINYIKLNGYYDKWWEYEYNEDGVMVKATEYIPI